MFDWSELLEDEICNRSLRVSRTFEISAIFGRQIFVDVVEQNGKGLTTEISYVHKLVEKLLEVDIA